MFDYDFTTIVDSCVIIVSGVAAQRLRSPERGVHARSRDRHDTAFQIDSVVSNTHCYEDIDSRFESVIPHVNITSSDVSMTSEGG